MQWEVLDRAFTGHATMVLIGDPKQAIYAFRGGDVVTYLEAGPRRRRPAHARHQLAQRRGAGRAAADRAAAARHSDDPDIVVHDVEADARRTPAGRGAAQRRRSGCGWSNDPRSAAATPTTCRSTCCAATFAADLAADIGALLASGATYDGKPVQAGDIAVIVEQHQRRPCVS